MTKKRILGLILILQCGLAPAQDPDNQDKDQLYVTDKLRLSLYANANERSQVLKYLSSGDKLAVEQLSGAYALVTAPDGSKGWVKRGFLVTEPTASLRLLAEQQKIKDLEAEISKLTNSKIIIDQYEKDMDAMAEKMDLLEDEKLKAAESIAELEQEIEARQTEIEQQRENSAPAIDVLSNTLLDYWKIIVPVIVAIVLLSFFVSKLIVEARIKSKFHGIKIW